VLSRIDIRTDMTAFLPEGRTEAARLVMQEARQGTATGLILVGIEGAPVADLARIGRGMAAALRDTELFAAIAGGQSPISEAEEAMLFSRRYLLSPATTAEAFEPASLRSGMQAVLRQMQSSAAPLAVRYGVPDPIGAFFIAMRPWIGASTIRVIDGAWFAAGQDRALLLARTKAGGMDVPAQETATAAIQRAFDATGPGGARLLVAGPAVFARDAARAIKSDVERISLLSAGMVVLLLWWRFRSPLVVAAIAAPVVLSVAAAAAVVQAIYGSVHGVALGFGITMLGVSVDYPVLMIGHRKAGEAARGTRARIGRAFVLAVITATLGLGAMVFSGFPGLSQLGTFAAAGLVAAALATWFLLPLVVVAADLAPVAAGSPAWLARVEGWRRWRWGAVALVLLAFGWLAVRGGPDWQQDLESLSPVPAASRALDAELRHAIGAPDVGQLLMLRGPDPQAVLRAQEALLPLLDRLVAQGVLTGAELAARLLPSAALQEARRATLPDAATLAVRIDQAREGLPFRPDAFAAFATAVQASRTMQPLLPGDLAGTPVAARLEPLLYQRDGVWQGPVALQGVRHPAALAVLLSGQQGAVYTDMRAELGGILAGYTGRAWRWLGWSLLAVLVVLAVGLRGRFGLVARVLGAVGGALVLTMAVLTAAGVQLSLLHLVALQLVAGVGLDYALFFARRQLDTEERARTLRTLVTCNAMTLLTFGALAGCQTPIMRDIGVTVAIGAVSAMIFAFLFAGEAHPVADPA
jgi:predicted exporter